MVREPARIQQSPVSVAKARWMTVSVACDVQGRHHEGPANTDSLVHRPGNFNGISWGEGTLVISPVWMSDMLLSPYWETFAALHHVLQTCWLFTPPAFGTEWLFLRKKSEKVCKILFWVACLRFVSVIRTWLLLIIPCSHHNACESNHVWYSSCCWDMTFRRREEITARESGVSKAIWQD